VLDLAAYLDHPLPAQLLVKHHPAPRSFGRVRPGTEATIAATYPPSNPPKAPSLANAKRLVTNTTMYVGAGELPRTPSRRSSRRPGPIGQSYGGRAHPAEGYYRFLMYIGTRNLPALYIRRPLSIGPGPGELPRTGLTRSRRAGREEGPRRCTRARAARPRILYRKGARPRSDKVCPQGGVIPAAGIIRFLCKLPAKRPCLVHKKAARRRTGVVRTS
jgi:hypothetical protein